MDGLSPSRRRLQSGLYLDTGGASFEDFKGGGSFDSGMLLMSNPPPHHHRPRLEAPRSDGSHGSEMSEYGWYDDDAINSTDSWPVQHDHVSVLNRMESLRHVDDSSTSNGNHHHHHHHSHSSQHHHHHHHHHQHSSISNSNGGGGGLLPLPAAAPPPPFSVTTITTTGSNGKKICKSVLFLLTQKNFTVTTRRWEEFSTSRSYFLALGVGGFRIVQDQGGQHAEYNLIVCMNSQTYCIWKRYNHFATLIEDAKRYHTSRQLKKTVAAWVELEKTRKWWRCLDVKYLYQKCTMLELFLKEMVYEIRSPTLLIKFAAAKE